jgi:hypothetical protein
VPNKQIGGCLVEVRQLPGPRPQVSVLFVGGIGEHLQQLGVADGAAAILRRARALAVPTTGLSITGSEHLDVVLPAVAEVVEVVEAGG